MNAGLKEYEIFNNLISIKTTSGVFFKDEIDFTYRYTDIDSPILEASFTLEYGFDEEKVKMFKKMRANQHQHQVQEAVLKIQKMIMLEDLWRKLV